MSGYDEYRFIFFLVIDGFHADILQGCYVGQNLCSGQSGEQQDQNNKEEKSGQQ